MDSASTTCLNPFGSHMRKSLVCTSPFFHWLLLLRVRVLASCRSSYNSLWFNVIDQTIANQVVQSSYLRWLNFLQPAHFLVCTLVNIFHQYYLWWYNYWYYYITLMDIVVIATTPSKEYERRVYYICPSKSLVSTFVLDTFSSTRDIHTPSLWFTTERVCNCKSSGGSILTA
jgi:hypothetical protein